MTWRGLLLGFVAGIIALPLAAWLYAESGRVPLAATASPLPLERYFARTALRQKIDLAAPKSTPGSPDAAQLIGAARDYKDRCEMCHGLPGAPSSISRAMFPHPPALLQGKGVTDDPVEDTFWVVKNGIRLSGMPAFGQMLSDSDIWRISYLLKNAGNLPEPVRKELQPPPPAVASAAH
jgi:thiosulfate dehydrogenase